MSAGGVAGRFQHVKRERACLDHVALADKHGIVRRIELKILVAEHAVADVGREIGVGHIHRCAGRVIDLLQPHAVIEMAVREQNGAHMEMAALDIVENEIGVRAGVNDGGVERRFVRDDVAVGLQVSDFDGFDEHGSFLLGNGCAAAQRHSVDLLTGDGAVRAQRDLLR